MKLPDNKRDRNMILALAAVAVISVPYLLVQLGLKPLRAEWTKARQEKFDTALKVDKAETELAKMPQRRIAYRDIVTELAGISEQNVLHAVLGSYLLRVRQSMENLAEACGFQVDSVREIGILEIPGKREDRDRVFKSYSVQVSGTGSFGALCRLIQRLEESSPYLSVSAIVISAQPTEPQAHRITFSVQWPIWRDPSLEPTAQEIANEKAPVQQP